jgi:nicotinamide-nucleotide amidase
MNAIIVSVGNELTSGQTVDTNSAYLSRRIAEFGICPLAHWTVGDSRRDIAEAIARASGSADVVIVSGGLGPTADDQTRQAVAEALGCELVLDEGCLARIEEFFRARGRVMGEANRIQAMAPRGAELLENKVGTAPGLFARIGEAAVFVVPGVPSEMEWMFDNQIAPRLPRNSGVTIHRTIHTFGAGESDVGTRILDLMQKTGPVLVGTTVAAGMVSIRIISRGKTGQEAQAQSEEVAQEVKRRLGELVIGEGSQSMAARVGEMLRERRQTLATAESCTGGLLGQMITSVPGASDYYLGGVISYANRVKEQLLGVEARVIAEHGAVSEEVAGAMAHGARKLMGSDWAISITGVAGPGGSSAEKPVGLVWMALAGPGGVKTSKTLWGGTREIIRVRAALNAINMLRLELMNR